MGSGGSGASITVSGTASFQWTWVSTTTPVEPAPSQVIITEAVSSSMAFFYGNASLPPVKTTYEAKDASSGTVTVSVPVSVTATFSTYTKGVLNASASASPTSVIITPGGAVQDSSYNYDILVGQGCTSSLSGIPSGCTVSNYQWSVSGITFQKWSGTTPALPPAPANLNASYEVDGPGPLTNPTAHWYWDDVKGVKTVSCTATVTPPSGQGSPFPISVTQNVTLAVPQTTESPTVGNVQINNHPPAVYGTGYALYVGGNSNQPYGIFFTTQVLTPTLFASPSYGIWNMVQCVAPNLWTTRYQSWEVADPGNGGSGLDTRYPFYPGNGSNPSFPSGIVANNLIAQPYDGPGLGNLSNTIRRYRVQERFNTFVMYLPPGTDTQWVPVWLIDWGWSADDTATIVNGLPDWSKTNASSSDAVGINSNARTLLFPKWQSVIHG